ncbi:F0F1 ATP synthase subunit epsilon [Nisaea denitrificans]|uniref:F0F1 ATP synthase subunit epsilon n=1 Tax=Nisaea denitrificans TaxID=390877 RepID=UPI0003F9BD6C|nr:F0F1 ATP synthase subunit epsilon [Nisaea denitrificans]
MNLTIATPLEIVVDGADVSHLRAEDETGAFGLLPGHADFLTELAISVVTWRDADGAEHHVAVRGGMLNVRDGASIKIATREAVPGDDLQHLETEVLDRFRRHVSEEKSARTDAHRLYLAAIQQIVTALRPNASGIPGQSLAPGSLPEEGV